MSTENQFSICNFDLESITRLSMPSLLLLKNTHIFMTGCTSFLGIWLVEGLLWGNLLYDLNLKITLLTRNKHHLLLKFSHLIFHKNLTIYEGNILEDYTHHIRGVTHILHGANLCYNNSLQWSLNHIDTAIDGTRAILKLAKDQNCKSVLLLSSGGAYESGMQNSNPPYVEIENIASSYINEKNVYSTCKYVQEMIAVSYGEMHNVRVIIARCFSFMGLHMPLHDRQALSSFFKSAILNEDIIIHGDGKALRTYMYCVDMVVWILAALTKGAHARPYNIGSDYSLSIYDLAQKVVDVTRRHLKIHVLNKTNKGNAPSMYVPNISRAQNELNLSISVNLEDGIKKTWEDILHSNSAEVMWHGK